MNYLLLYFDEIQKRYIYRIFDNIENAFNYRQKILKSGLANTCYLYKLYGRSGGIHVL